jgi:hypothetical protein
MQEDITRLAQCGQPIESVSASLTRTHLRQLHVASVLTAVRSVTVSPAYEASAGASLWLDHTLLPKLPAPLAHAAATIHVESRQQMLSALQKDSLYMHSVQIVRESLSSLRGVTLLTEVPTIASLHDAHVSLLCLSASAVPNSYATAVQIIICVVHGDMHMNHQLMNAWSHNNSVLKKLT